ncbi:MAG: imidazole glycerol phosphate synthase subunit HisH [bacterium]
MISIIDYGVGNLRSLQNAFRFLGVQSEIVDSPAALARATKIVLPGVGAFGFAMQNLQSRGLVPPLLQKARNGTPLLGICLGMQVLLTDSQEGGSCSGLGLIPGSVQRIDCGEKVPHIGWNEIVVANPRSTLLRNLPPSRFAYFVHSYVCAPADHAVVAACCEYGTSFCAVIEKDTLFGVQFHPEKSQELGLQILKNFAEL